ncbi:hypothetical protein [Streptomyces sp. NPDC005865]|uniref:hypothetical protein n=1 Tax=Streptomyces sp. NPDC005865 TaxID=3155453 RepID=UPI0033E4147D
MKRGKTRWTWGDVEMRAAGAASAAQIPVAGLVSFIVTLGQDDHEVGGGPDFGLACAILFAPLLLPVLGVVHSGVLTLPAVWLGRRAAAVCGRGPEWAWSVGCLVPVGVAWAGFFAALGAPFAGPAGWITASGVVPALNVAYCRRREERLGRPLRKVWILSGLVSLALCATVFGAAVVATETGLLKEYEPPRLAPEQVAGAWRDEDGKVRFRLHENGRADVPSCGDATGTWALTLGADSPARPVLDVDAGPLAADADAEGCESPRTWTVGGTEDDPELFVNLGSMDDPDIETLHRGG